MVKRKRTKGQTTQWSKEKGQKDKQHNGQKKKDKRTNNTMVKRKKNKRTNNDLQNIHYKTKDRVTRTPLKQLGVNSVAPEGKEVPAALVAPVVLI
jgi:hypothetical protein